MKDKRRKKNTLPLGSPEPSIVTESGHGAVRIQVLARPRSGRSVVSGERGGAVVVHLAAPPVDGAANAELVATLARCLGVPKRDVTIVHGESSRSKVVEVRGLSAADVRERLGKPRA